MNPSNQRISSPFKGEGQDGGAMQQLVPRFHPHPSPPPAWGRGDSSLLNWALLLFGLSLTNSAYAAEMVSPSPAGGLAKVVVGLLIVLAVIAGVAWLVKQLAAGKTGSYSVARIVGGVSVGTRERVVVVEIGDRWVVVGVAPGQVNAIATLEAGSQLPEIEPAAAPLADTSFAKWLKKAVQKNSPQ